MKKTFTLLCCVATCFLISQSCGEKKNNSSDGLPSITERRAMLKNLALCNCIQYISHDDTIKNDISTSIFMELSDFNPKVWKSIDSLSAVAASEVQPSQIADYNGQKPYLKGCIDFYHSKRLDSLVKTFNKGYEK